MELKKLTEAERERLIMLAEECAEVIQIVGKILRHGYESFNPDDWQQITNKELLMNELRDIEGVLFGMILNGDIESLRLKSDPRIVWNKKLRWTHHQKVE